jgi:hypothetical protein
MAKKTKVFGVGFHKTGTSTLNSVLTELGYNVCSNRIDLAQVLIDENYDEAYDMFEKFDAFEDNPWPLLYKKFDTLYPGSKFILTLRDEDKWWNSLLNHFGSKHSLMREWIYGVGCPQGNETIYRDRYKRHNEGVVNFFKDRPDSLLIVDWSEIDGKWDSICEFLKEPIPKSSFPHSNKMAYSKIGRIIQKVKLKYYRVFVKPRLMKNK